jgi:hypothetical protein
MRREQLRPRCAVSAALLDHVAASGPRKIIGLPVSKLIGYGSLASVEIGGAARDIPARYLRIAMSKGRAEHGLFCRKCSRWTRA